MRRKPILPFDELVINGITTYVCRLGNKRIVVPEIDVGLLSNVGIYTRDQSGDTRFFQYFIDLDEVKYRIVADLIDTNLLSIVSDPNFVSITAQQIAMITGCTGHISSVTCENGFPTTAIEYDFQSKDRSVLKGLIIVNQIDGNIPYGILTNNVIGYIESNNVDFVFKKRISVHGNDSITRDFGVAPIVVDVADIAQDVLQVIQAEPDPFEQYLTEGELANQKTMAELAAMKIAGTLVVGQHYVITDLATQTVDYYGGPVPKFVDASLLVLGVGPETLASEVISSTYPQDLIYFDTSDANPVNWNISYRKDNLKNLSTYYDWRRVQWRRWETAAGSLVFTSLIDTGGQYQDLFTFHDSSGGACSNVSIGRDSTNSIFVNGSRNSTLGSGCNDNILGVFGSTIGNLCQKNICLHLETNIIGEQFEENVLLGQVRWNTIKNYFIGNIIDQWFESNIINDDFLFNTIGTKFSNNTIGVGFMDHTVGNNFRKNNIDHGFWDVIDFSSATLVYADFSTDLFVNSAGAWRLRYTNGADTVVYAALTD